MKQEKDKCTDSGRKKLRIALVGNPNCGKSTLFNLLTGLNQSTANFPGATVDKKTGFASIKDVHIEFLDLPGIYSLNAKSPDEKIAVSVLTEKTNPDHPDMVLCVADASNLKRSMFLVTQIIELNIPVVVALNMMDVVKKGGMEINEKLLSERLGVKTVGISAREEKGIEELKNAIVSEINVPGKNLFISENTSKDYVEKNIERYRFITKLISGCISVNEKKAEDTFTSRADNILTHKIWGYVIFLAILFLIFESIFVIAAYPMEWIEWLFVFFSKWGAANLPEGEFSDLLVNGILAGISGIAVFIPQIALLFFFIIILEDTGYMARVSFIMDKVMRRFGLNGRSVIPLLSGAACAVPAIMSTRTIYNWKERLITILVTPLISCSARLPVYTLMIALVIPADKVFGFFNIQGVVLFLLYIIGFLVALLSALAFKYILMSAERSYFIMELPPYRSPRWKNIGIAIIDRIKVFLLDAGKIIIAISVILWFLASHGPENAFDEIEKKYYHSISEQERANPEEDIKAAIAAEKLGASYAGIIGRTIEPLIKPLGFDWKIGVALVTSFAAREVFVGTMATIYSVGDETNNQSIREKMRSEINPETQKPQYSMATGLSLMLFYAFAMQCMSTLSVVYCETKQWKWPIIQFLFMGLLAYLSSWITYTVFK